MSKNRNFSLQTHARCDSSQRAPVSHTTTEQTRERTRKRKGEKRETKEQNAALSILSSAHPTCDTSTCSRASVLLSPNSFKDSYEILKPTLHTSTCSRAIAEGSPDKIQERHDTEKERRRATETFG